MGILFGRPDRKAFRPNLLWLLFIVAAIWVAAMGALLYFDYRSTIANVVTVNERTADLVEKHATWSLENAFKVLTRAHDIISQWDRQDPVAGDVAVARLGDLVLASDTVGSIWAVSNKARPFIDHTTRMPAQGFVGDRPYFRVHADGRQALWVGPAGMGTLVNRRRFTLSLPLYASDQFGGVVVVGIESDFFTSLYGLVRWTQATRLELVSERGDILARWPQKEGSEPQDDGADTIVTAERSISKFGARVVVSSDASHAISQWRQRSAPLATLSGLGIVALTGFGFLVQQSAQGRLRRMEERSREAQRHAQIGSWEANLETGEVWWSDAVFEIFGQDRASFDPTLPQIIDVVHPDDRELVRANRAQITASGSLDLIHRIVRPDGSVRHVHQRAKTIRVRAGRPIWLVGTVQDVTEQRVATAALEDSNQLLGSVIEHMPAMVFVKRASDLRFVRFNQAGEKLLGYNRSELIGKSDHDFFTKEQADFFIATDRGVLANSEGRTIDEETIKTKDGSTRYLMTSKCALRDASGAPLYLLGVSLDITAQKAAKQQIDLLLREVNHRAKNLLAVVQAVARHTAGESDPKHFAVRFAQRLAGLAASHDLLIKNAWQGVDAGDLVSSQLSHFRDLIGTRVRLDGPGIRLNPQAAQAIGMAVHELSTNAAKHGSLSIGDGQVSVWWGMNRKAAGTFFEMRWTEHGGPTPEQPRKIGFGSKVLREMVEHTLGCEVSLEYLRSGLVWMLCAPAEQVLDKQSGIQHGWLARDESGPGRRMAG